MTQGKPHGHPTFFLRELSISILRASSLSPHRAPVLLEHPGSEVKKQLGRRSPWISHWSNISQTRAGETVGGQGRDVKRLRNWYPSLTTNKYSPQESQPEIQPPGNPSILFTYFSPWDSFLCPSLFIETSWSSKKNTRKGILVSDF